MLWYSISWQVLISSLCPLCFVRHSKACSAKPLDLYSIIFRYLEKSGPCCQACLLGFLFSDLDSRQKTLPLYLYQSSDGLLNIFCPDVLVLSAREWPALSSISLPEVKGFSNSLNFLTVRSQVLLEFTFVSGMRKGLFFSAFA